MQEFLPKNSNILQKSLQFTSRHNREREDIERDYIERDDDHKKAPEYAISAPEETTTSKNNQSKSAINHQGSNTIPIVVSVCISVLLIIIMIICYKLYQKHKARFLRPLKTDLDQQDPRSIRQGLDQQKSNQNQSIPAPTLLMDSNSRQTRHYNNINVLRQSQEIDQIQALELSVNAQRPNVAPVNDGDSDSNLMYKLNGLLFNHTIQCQFNKKLSEYGETSCVICFDDFSTDVTIIRKVNRCGHVFHNYCLENWFRAHLADTRCPLCNLDIQGKDQAQNV